MTEYVADTIVPSLLRTVSGDAQSDTTQWGKCTQLRAQLDVTAQVGTTLDVDIEDSLDGTNWNTLASFTQVGGATGREVINHVTTFGNFLRIAWTIVGTSYTFSVKVIGKGA